MADIDKALDNDVLLEELNKQQIKEYAPVIAYVVFVVVLGIAGNIMTVIFYGFKTRKTTNTIFISSLAAIDLVTCVIQSDEIIEICFSITFKNAGGCKFMYFINHFLVASSVLVLWVICIDRYRKVCRYFAWQFTMMSVKIAIVAVIGFALLIAIPNWVELDIVLVNVTDDNKNVLQAYYCTHSRDEELQKAIKAFHLLDFLIFIVVITSCIVLYTLVIRTIYISRRKTRLDTETTYNKRIVRLGNESVVSDSVEHSSVAEDKVTCSDSVSTLKHKDSKSITDTIKKAYAHRHHKSANTSKEAKHAAETRITFMMVAITIGFLVSFVPYFVVNIVVKPNSQSSEEFNVGIQLALRSFMMNSAINPYIIGVFNPVFRRFVTRVFCKCCYSMSANTPVTSTAEAHLSQT